jgi:hypothetical protein
VNLNVVALNVLVVNAIVVVSLSLDASKPPTVGVDPKRVCLKYKVWAL